MRGSTKEGAVLVTGASRGLGRSIAMELNARGYRVFAGVRKSADVDSLRNASDGKLSPIFLDVTRIESVDEAFQEISRGIGDDGLAHLKTMKKLRYVKSIKDKRIYNLAVRSGKSNPHHDVGYLIHPAQFRMS